MKKVSIIIPAYNEEKTIGKLLDKIIKIQLNQINFEKEIIVVDDGSDDNTSNICEKYQNIKLLKQTNMGKGKAVQNGIKFSKGNYILIQDADLEYDPISYIELLKPFNQSNKNIAVFGSRYLKNNRSLRKKPFQDQNLFAFFFNYFLSFFFLCCTENLLATYLQDTKFMKKFFLKKIQFTPLDLKLTMKSQLNY